MNIQPNLPNTNVKGVLIDYRTPFSAVEKLKSMGISVYFTKPCEFLYEAVSGHPDMTICHVNDDIYVCEPRLYDYYKKRLPMLDIQKGDTYITSTYPYDIAYNAARAGELCICNMEYTDNKILAYLRDFNIKIINVKQGYAKCSVCAVSENAIITADKGIAKIASNYIDVLRIEQGFIKLKGLDYGFIGGACGKIAKNTLAVCGDLRFHKDFDKIERFCADRNVHISMLTDDMPYDIGTIIPVY